MEKRLPVVIHGVVFQAVDGVIDQCEECEHACHGLIGCLSKSVGLTQPALTFSPRMNFS
jgi:hypothetical protein